LLHKNFLADRFREQKSGTHFPARTPAKQGRYASGNETPFPIKATAALPVQTVATAWPPAAISGFAPAFGRPYPVPVSGRGLFGRLCVSYR
jgi:hypothetical protein